MNFQHGVFNWVQPDRAPGQVDSAALQTLHIHVKNLPPGSRLDDSHCTDTETPVTCLSVSYSSGTVALKATTTAHTAGCAR